MCKQKPTELSRPEDEQWTAEMDDDDDYQNNHYNDDDELTVGVEW